MTNADAKTQAPPMPKPLGGLTPYLQLDGALKAAAFYEKAFGAEQVFAVPPDEQGRTMQLHLTADTIDSWWQRAVDAGCEVVMPLDVMFWGDRWGSLRDPFGVDWAMNAPVNQ